MTHLHMLGRNEVNDDDQWKAVFDEQTPAANAAGLRLVRLWRSADRPDNEAFFVFEVPDRAKAEAFVNAPESADAGQRAGATGGEI